MALLSHLFLFAPLVTSQLPPAGNSGKPAPKAPPLSSHLAGPGAPSTEEVVIRAQQQEKIGNIYHLRGDVEITYRGYTLRAEEVTYNADNGNAEARGGVTLDGGPRNEHLSASHADYNVRNEAGNFFDVVGVVGAVYHGHTAILTTTNPFAFTGQRVEKVQARYIVHHGTITSCALPHPKWNFEADTMDVVPGEEARMYQGDFRLLGIPVFFFPYLEHPIDNLGRHSGFLLPSVGESNTKGFIFGDGVYWAINRSMDASAAAEYFSKRGWSQTGSFRAKPSETSSFDMHYFGVLDRGAPVTGQDQGGEDVKLNGEWVRDGWRAVASADYLSSFLFRLAWAETYSQAIDSEVHSNLFLSKNFDGYSFGLLVSRYQNFQSITSGDEIKILHAPSFEFSSVDRAVARTPFTWGFDTTAEGLNRSEPGFVTNPVVGRFDGHPRAALPLAFAGWTLRPEVALRDTYYTEQQLPPSVSTVSSTVGTPISQGLNRQDAEFSVELRPPSLARVFGREIFGRRIKHVIEPRMSYNYVTGVDNFPNVLRFDARDILSNTNEVELGMVNRIYAKRQLPPAEQPCEPPPTPLVKNAPVPLPGSVLPIPKCEDQGSTTRELLSWEIKQKYFFNPSFGNAIVPGQLNVLTSTAEYAAFAFLTGARNWSPIVSKLRLQTSANTDVQWEIDYDPRLGEINTSTAFVEYRIGDIVLGGSQVFFRIPGILIPNSEGVTPPPDFNQFRFLVGYGHPNRQGLSAGASIGYDEQSNYLQFGAAQASYNWDCCGLSFEYRRFSLSSAITSIRNENEYRFALTLANIGTFGNLRRQERLF